LHSLHSPAAGNECCVHGAILLISISQIALANGWPDETLAEELLELQTRLALVLGEDQTAAIVHQTGSFVVVKSFALSICKCDPGALLTRCALTLYATRLLITQAQLSFIRTLRLSMIVVSWNRQTPWTCRSISGVVSAPSGSEFWMSISVLSGQLCWKRR
jgi:hypothetical protein